MATTRSSDRKKEIKSVCTRLRNLAEFYERNTATAARDHAESFAAKGSVVREMIVAIKAIKP